MLLRTLFLTAAATVLPFAAGCSSSHHDNDRVSRRSDDRYGRTSDRYDNARVSRGDVYDNNNDKDDHAPWRDSSGRLHHDRDWKDASDRGRLPNDRDWDGR